MDLVKTYYNKEDDSIQMAMKDLACVGNRDYYDGEVDRYNTNLAEIDAELTALVNTYDYLSDKFSKDTAEQLVCDLVNFKAGHLDYFIKGHYDNFDDIAEAFSDQYERAKFANISHWVIRLRPSQQVNPDDDEYVQYLQQIVKDDEKNSWLMEAIWDEHDTYERDRMIAAIVLHIHPEIDYKRVYPCLKDEDLSPEAVFGRSIPPVPDIQVYDEEKECWVPKHVGCELNKEDLEARITKADELHKLYGINKYEPMPQKFEQIDETKLPIEDKEFHNDLSPPL